MESDDDKRALREAALNPTIAQRFYSKYDGSPLPPESIARNVLTGFGVPADKAGSVYKILLLNAEFVGFLKQIKDKQFIDVGAALPPVSVSSTQMEMDDYAESNSSDTEELSPLPSSGPIVVDSPPIRSHKNAIFLGHGSNHRPMDQLVKILHEYGIPHKRAEEEANRARGGKSG